MAFKINIGTPEGKTYKFESESQALVGKSLGDKVSGNDLGNADLKDHEFEITGASDKSGIPALKEVEGFTRKRVLLTYGKGMHKRPKHEGKKERSNPTPGGLRLRKNIHGKTISENIVQVNLKPTKEGSKKLAEIFGPKTEENAEEKKE
jgi:small subunit ribosomal protein S6e